MGVYFILENDIMSKNALKNMSIFIEKYNHCRIQMHQNDVKLQSRKHNVSQFVVLDDLQSDDIIVEKCTKNSNLHHAIT